MTIVAAIYFFGENAWPLVASISSKSSITPSRTRIAASLFPSPNICRAVLKTFRRNINAGQKSLETISPLSRTMSKGYREMLDRPAKSSFLVTNASFINATLLITTICPIGNVTVYNSPYFWQILPTSKVYPYRTDEDCQ